MAFYMLMAKSSENRSTKIKLSGIIAAIWIGILGFNLLIQDLESTQVFLLILISLILGSVLTYTVITRTFAITKESTGDVDIEKNV